MVATQITLRKGPGRQYCTAGCTAWSSCAPKITRTPHDQWHQNQAKTMPMRTSPCNAQPMRSQRRNLDRQRKFAQPHSQCVGLITIVIHMHLESATVQYCKDNLRLATPSFSKTDDLEDRCVARAAQIPTIRWKWMLHGGPGDGNERKFPRWKAAPNDSCAASTSNLPRSSMNPQHNSSQTQHDASIQVAPNRRTWNGNRMRHQHRRKSWSSSASL